MNKLNSSQNSHVDYDTNRKLSGLKVYDVCTCTYAYLYMYALNSTNLLNIYIRNYGNKD